jgi:hypothetical protein
VSRCRGHAVLIARAPVPVPDLAALTDVEGRFTLSLPVRGSYEVACIAEGYAPSAATIEVAEDQELRLELRLMAARSGRSDAVRDCCRIRADSATVTPPAMAPGLHPALRIAASTGSPRQATPDASELFAASTAITGRFPQIWAAPHGRGLNRVGKTLIRKRCISCGRVCI